MKHLSTKSYKNNFVNTFNGDDSGDITPRQTPGVLYSKAKPTPVKKPSLLAWSEDLAEELEVEKPDQKDVEILGGNLVAPTMVPYAACYAGHQFGSWAGQLGDGRAITLGEWENSKGKTWELQLKGAGMTAYSRRADGRAVLRSSVREYLMSEAMHYLGVPTTRALSLVTTGDQVLRDMFYDGHPAYEPGAIVMRVAPTFLRFGNFEMLASRNEVANLEKLVNWTIDNFYSHIQGEDRILRWFGEVVEKTASLMVEWMRVGFVHGVMNTDNMSILGLTIDYGPYSFVDDFDLNFTPNTTDLPGRRYAFGKQPSISYWNLGCLGGALAPLFKDVRPLQTILDGYQKLYWQKFYTMMGNKLGLDLVTPEDKELIHTLEKTLAALNIDMTMFFQKLIGMPTQENEHQAYNHFEDCFYNDLAQSQKKLFFDWINKYQLRIAENTCNEAYSIKKMKESNPRFVLRNYLLHQAIEGLEKGNDALFIKLQEAMKDPYTDIFPEFFTKRPDWAGNKAGCSMLSCSS